MIKQLIFGAIYLAVPAAGTGAIAEPVSVITPGTSMVFSAPKGGDLKILHYGTRLTPADLQSVASAEGMPAYPVYGMDCPSESALAVTHADGNMTLKMVVDTCFTTVGTGSTVTCVRLRDEAYPFFVDVFYRAYDDVDIVENWVEISHREKKPVALCLGLYAVAAGERLAVSSPRRTQQ